MVLTETYWNATRYDTSLVFVFVCLLSESNIKNADNSSESTAIQHLNYTTVFKLTFEIEAS